MIIISAILFYMQSMFGTGTTAQTSSSYDTGSVIVVQDQQVVQ